MRVQSIRKGLLSWYDVHRRRLPWRGDVPPFTGSGSKEQVSKRRSSAVNKESVASNGQPTLHSMFNPKPSPKGEPPEPAVVEDCVPILEDIREIDAQPPVTKSAYATWVSEIMLQQTRVEAVISHFLRWMSKFPNVQALASASEEEVVAQWAGLGYYRRARLLRNGAIYILEKHGGALPSTIEQLLEVPGIGDYTAGAIASIAHGVSAPLVDGNVIRVLARLTARPGAANDAELKHYCWAAAATLVPPASLSAPAVASASASASAPAASSSAPAAGELDRPGDFNQSIMELGATVCTPTAPDCEHCPIRGSCRAYALLATARTWASVTTECGDIEELPVAAPVAPAASLAASAGKSATPASHPLPLTEPVHPAQFPAKAVKAESRAELVEAQARFAIDGDGRPNVLLRRRPDKGLLAGQWDLPMTITLAAGAPAKRSREPLARADAVASASKAPRAASADSARGAEAVQTEAADAVNGVSSAGVHAAERWRCAEYTYIFSGARQRVVVQGSIEPQHASATLDEKWVAVSSLMDVGLSSFACKAIATALQQPLVARSAAPGSISGTFGALVARQSASSVTELLARSKLKTQAAKSGWWTKR